MRKVLVFAVVIILTHCYYGYRASGGPAGVGLAVGRAAREAVGYAGPLAGLRAALRQKDTPYAELGLDDADLDDGALLDAIAAHPVLLNRPFVETPRGVRLCRPSEVVLEILENPDIGPFTKEDGEVVVFGGARS